MHLKGRHKLNRREGFSLTELLVAVLILGMVSSVVAGGVPVARDAYNKVTVTANAQVLLSNTITALRNELGTSIQVEDTDDNGVTYFNSRTGIRSKLYEEDNQIKIDGYKMGGIAPENKVTSPLLSSGVSPDDNKVTSPLLSSGVSPDGLYIQYGTVSASDGIVTFSELNVYVEGSSDSRVSLNKLTIRTLDG